jgi:hypothetical protein
MYRAPMPSLLELALDIAASSLEETMIPFALINGGKGMTHLTIVTGRSDRALHLGRRMVREHAEGATEYAIVVDAFVRSEGVRQDALFVEMGAAGSKASHVTVHRYRRESGAKPTFTGESFAYETRPSALVRWDPLLELEWGAVTPDFYNKEQNHAVHVVNHDLESTDNVARTVRFLRARARFFACNMPPNPKQSAFVDDRGQDVPTENREMLARGLAGAVELKYLAEEER